MAQTMLLSRVSTPSALSNNHVAEAEASLKAREFLGARQPSSLRASTLSAFLPEAKGVQLRPLAPRPGQAFALFDFKKNTPKKADPKKVGRGGPFLPRRLFQFLFCMGMRLSVSRDISSSTSPLQI